MELGRNGQHHRRHVYYVQGLQRCPGVRCRLLQLFMHKILNRWKTLVGYVYEQIWQNRMKQIFHRAHLRFQQLPWPSWLRRSLSKREIMSSNLIGSTQFCGNDTACSMLDCSTASTSAPCHYCNLAAQTFSMWRLIEFVSVQKMRHACHSLWPRGVDTVAAQPYFI